jgi:hypothetical protein
VVASTASCRACAPCAGWRSWTPDARRVNEGATQVFGHLVREGAA